MGLTDFPNGISSFGMPVLGSGVTIPPTTGNVFFVDSGNTHAADGSAATSPDKPAATIDGAINKCTANNGDIIIVMPGHTESLTTATSIAMDVAGVSVIGLGQGNTRPVLTYDAAAGAVAISASNVRWSNIVHMASFADVTNAIICDNTITNVEIDHCKFTFDATGIEFAVMIKLGSGATDSADEVYIHDNWFRAENADGAASAILMDDCDDIHIIGNLFTGDWNSVCIDGAASSSACKDYVIAYNIMYQKDDGTGCIDLDDAATGIGCQNYFGGADALADNCDWGALFLINNYVCDAADSSGVIVPTTTSS
jgi:hypothetical protein